MPKNIIMDSQILTTLMACPRKADLRFNQDLQRADGGIGRRCGRDIGPHVERPWAYLHRGREPAR